jgi:putative endonuclease
MTKNYYVYIATNKLNRVLYVGVTSSLINRLDQHRSKIHQNSFTARYNINKLVYYEIYTDVYDALEREKQIKGRSRIYKLDLIRKFNPKWNDILLGTY